jgi:hypothetical protein
VHAELVQLYTVCVLQCAKSTGEGLQVQEA